VPLFIEEVTRLLLERGEQGGIQAIPPTLQQLLTARLDRLGAAREVAQIGAVLGRDFSYGVLRALAGIEDAPLQLALDRLAEADILLVQGTPPDSDYRFKHALIQDAAYENLLKSRRQFLHLRIADTLHGSVAPTTVEPELLAHHFAEAGMMEAAIEWWGKAGHRSLQRSALAEAVEQITRALNQIAALPSSRELRRKEIELQVALITPLIHLKRYTATETKAATERARLLIEKADSLGEASEPLLLFSVLYGVFVAKIVAADFPASRVLAAQFLALAERENSTAPLLMAHRVMGQSLMFSGEIVAAREHLDRGIGLYDRAEHEPLSARFGHDAQVVMLSFRSWAVWLLGYPDAALKDCDDALKIARSMGQAATLMIALNFAVLTYILRGAYSAAISHAQELSALAEEKGAIWMQYGQANLGCALAISGKASDAKRLITSGVSKLQLTEARFSTPLWVAHLAIAHAKLGEFNDAWRCVEEAIRQVETSDERWSEANVYTVAGEMALLSERPDAAKAENYFDRALAVSRQQQAKSWELRAAMSMARLWRDQGKREEARELLAPVYGWFTEGFDTLDLKEAKALLDELSS
jgi:predicted ATPase